jgi:hypothetical protein
VENDHQRIPGTCGGRLRWVGRTLSPAEFDPIDFCRLTIGLMGLDELHLRVLATSSEEEAERTDAQIGACGVWQVSPNFS